MLGFSHQALNNDAGWLVGNHGVIGAAGFAARRITMPASMNWPPPVW
jgi:hypothetical protein